MNALPVGPEQIADPEQRRRYFRDLRHWHFDVPYTAVYAHTLQEIRGPLRERYAAFARLAHSRGYPACVQIQVTVCSSKDTPVSEAQHYRDGTPDLWGDSGFFASFASKRWRGYLKEITSTFVKEYGYDWVVFEEPMYRVDIPGRPDPFVEMFAQAHPNVRLPRTSSDTHAYRLVQELKAEVLTDFLRDLLSHAKEVGASQAGVMPWFFIPTIENTPGESMNTSCDIGQIVGLPELDFVVVRMQPDNIYADVMRTGDETQVSPMLYYPEVMAHHLGKPVIAVSNPSDEHADPSCPLLPLEFFQRSLLASLAASPCGMTRHWYGWNYGAERDHMAFFSRLLRFTNRLGSPFSPVAFVFSHSGARHGAPYPYHQIWRRWWAFGKEMMLEKLYPVLTLWASDLKRQLEANPGLRLLVLSSAFPLNSEQMSTVDEWLREDDGRGLVVFAESPQLSTDPSRPGHVQLDESFPGLHRLLGLPWPTALGEEKGKMLLAMDPGAADSFAGSLGLPADAAPIRKLKASAPDKQPPATAERKGVTIAVLPMGPVDFPEAICRFVRGVASHCGAEPPVVKEAHLSVLWSMNRNGYVVLSNMARTPSEAHLRTGEKRVWDVVRRRFYGPNPRLHIAPFQFRLVRLIPPEEPLLDVDRQMYIESIGTRANRTVIKLMARGAVTLRSRVQPEDIWHGDCPVAFSAVDRGGIWETRLEDEGRGLREYLIHWKV